MPKRVLLKLSGESLGGGKVGMDVEILRRLAKEIKAACERGVQVAIVAGGGTFSGARSFPRPDSTDPGPTT